MLGVMTNVEVAPNPTEARSSGRRWAWLSGASGTVLGALPHVLHHVGPLVGAAVLTGALGTVGFGLVGLAASVPMLLRLRRRTGSWRAPTIAAGLFVALYLVSALIVGPAISGAGPAAPNPAGNHLDHHQ